MNREKSMVAQCVPLIMQGLTNEELHEQTGISKNYAGQIRSVIDAMEIPPAPIKCAHCGALIQADSRFCSCCGVKILSREEELAERLEKCLNSASLLPSAAKDSFVKTVNEALAYFREKGDKQV